MPANGVAHYFTAEMGYIWYTIVAEGWIKEKNKRELLYRITPKTQKENLWEKLPWHS